MRAVFASLLGFAAASPWAQPNFNLPLDRPYTLRLAEPLVLESELIRQIQSGKPMSFIFPRPCFSESDSSRVCGEARGWEISDTARSRILGFSPQGGYEYRYFHENIHAFELGALATGRSGPISLYVDARTFTELHEDFRHASYDREFVERQDEEESGSLAYSSYSRYRANLSYDMSWGRFSAGRDAAHWGPALHHSLVFHQDAVPFNQLTFTSQLGPIQVQSLYGQLSIPQASGRFSSTDRQSHSFYAHRYEWSVVPDLLLGISEQLILYDYEEPFAFIPVVPLFIFKGDAYERLNNGNIAADATWRISRYGRIYTEFLVDDVQSPTSIFDDQLGSKWGLAAGLQGAAAWHAWNFSGLFEYARVEPWVYTHYKPNSAQAANQGHPLGNPNGPGFKAYAVSASISSPWGQTLRLRFDLIERGLDSGGAITDTLPRDDQDKSGFWDHTEMRPRLGAYFHQGLRYGALEAGWDWDGRGSGNSRTVIRVYGVMPRKKR